MARGAAKGTDDGLGPKRLARGPQAARAIGQMHPVKAQPFHHPRMARDDQRHIARMGHLAQGIGGAREVILILADQRQTQTGDRLGIQNRLQPGQKGIDLEALGRDKVEIGLIGLRHGRASLRLVG